MPPSIPAQETRPPSSSLAGRLLNVFAAPGDVFGEIKSAKPSTANWLVPVLLGCLVGIVYAVVVFSQESIAHSFRETQERQLQKRVDAGKMSKEQMEITEQYLGPGMMKIVGSFGAVIFNFVMVFFVGLVIWLLGAKAFKGRLAYMKAVEAAGLAGMINVLGGLIGMLLAVVMGNIAMTPGPVLLVHEFDPANKFHVLLSQLNVMMLWYVAVAAVALSKLSGASFGKTAAWLFGIWAALVLIFTLPGWGR